MKSTAFHTAREDRSTSFSSRTRFGRFPVILPAGILLFLCACGGGTPEQHPSKLTLERPSQEALASASYPLEGMDPLATVTLSGGRFENPSGHLRAALLDELLAYGDLNGNGTIDAAVVLVYETGGSGSFVELAVMESRDDSLACLGSAFLGDRVKPQSLRITPKKVAVDVITHGPEDPMCCPTQQAKWNFDWKDGLLRRIEEK